MLGLKIIRVRKKAPVISETCSTSVTFDEGSVFGYSVSRHIGLMLFIIKASLSVILFDFYEDEIDSPGDLYRDGEKWQRNKLLGQILSFVFYWRQCRNVFNSFSTLRHCNVNWSIRIVQNANQTSYYQTSPPGGMFHNGISHTDATLLQQSKS